MTEESLQKLFTDVKTAPAETNVAEVSQWIETVATVGGGTTIIQKLLQKKLIIMTSIITTALTISILLFSGKDNSKKPQNNSGNLQPKIIVQPTDTVFTHIDESNNPQLNFTSTIPDHIDTTSISLNNTVQADEDFQIQPESLKVNLLNPIENTSIDSQYNSSGSWKTIDDSLHVDTVFNGVKTLIFVGKTIGDISVVGGNRQDVEMNASLKIKTKTIFKNKNKNSKDYQLGYDLDGTILTINLEELTKKFVVEKNMDKQNNKIEFKVPENITVKINTGFGDIDIKGISNNIDIKTSFGDIKSDRIVGDIKLQSDYGDIIVDELNGKIDVNTGYGDINAKNITVKEMMDLKSGFGDIDLQITNPVSDCKMDLKTGFGKIKMKNKDLQLESKSKLTIGNGDIKISGKTGFGDVIIR
jgi:hypothetical protein